MQITTRRQPLKIKELNSCNQKNAPALGEGMGQTSQQALRHTLQRGRSVEWSLQSPCHVIQMGRQVFSKMVPMFAGVGWHIRYDRNIHYADQVTAQNFLGPNNRNLFWTEPYSLFHLQFLVFCNWSRPYEIFWITMLNGKVRPGKRQCASCPQESE